MRPGILLHSRTAMVDLIKRHVWIWPLLFACLLAAFGWTSLRALEQIMQEQVQSQLETTLESALAAIDIWANENQALMKRTAEDPRIVTAVERLVDAARRSGESRDALLAVPDQAELRELMDVITSSQGYTGWGSQTISGFMMANAIDENVGHRPRAGNQLLPSIFDGKTVLTPPILWDTSGDPASAVVTMILASPIRNSEGEVIASLGFALNPEKDFSRILNVARPGKSGETYAFDREGLLLSRSRFEDQLREIGLLPEDPTVTSALAIHIRAPGGNIVEGYVPKLAERARPLTTMAAEAIAGRDGFDVDGYSDYRGVAVVGAWRWLPDVEIGITTEMDVDEAYAGLFAIRARLLTLVGLLVVGAVGMFLYTFVVMRLQSEVAEAKQLGRYKIERKLGKGGMGTVYLARHALLRRPTAIKVLDGERADAEGVARFEREVQVSSSLSHPNTIEIYDYGYTPAGTFYYAMELLRGITFGTCVENDGGQSDERTVFVMKQACASLAEAHTAGLIHRDLKPSNVMLCERGGLLDFVKVLDFGLVRQEQQDQDVALTSINSLTGTPLYMSPEAVEAPDKMDARSDVYQLGAIAYYLLTGSHVFSGDSPVDVLAKHLNDKPESPSKRAGRTIHPDLEALVLRCLAKDVAGRPADASELLDALEAIALEGTWGQVEARAWWATFSETYPDIMEAEGASLTGSIPSAWSVDIHRRTLADAQKKG